MNDVADTRGVCTIIIADELFRPRAALILMTAQRRFAIVCAALGLAAGLHAGEIPLSDAEARVVARREVLVRATLDANHRRGTVRAVVLIDAPPAVVYRAMTRCADAFEFVPHLKTCRVLESAPDASWGIVEHEIDFGWYTPRIRWAFRAEFLPEKSITFRQVSGDFKKNEGAWEFEAQANGVSTLVKYQAAIDPPAFIPNWLARTTYKRELPQMLDDLRQLCEARHRESAPAR
ncbi:MAG: SRPBCC family protein [Steroidobacteraceae bacterium]|nr:SRPBCC family protein [Steroidobacteraceae bacterium]